MAFTKGSFDAAAIVTGTVATARLGTGTPSSSNFLRGDQSWAAAGGGPVARAGSNTTEATTTSGTQTDLRSVTGLSIAATTLFWVWVDVRKTSGGAASGTHTAFKLNTTALSTARVYFTTTDEAQSGQFIAFFGARVTSYLRAQTFFQQSRGPTDNEASFVAGTPTTDIPTASITDVIQRTAIGGAGITIGANEMHVYTIATS